MKKRLFIISIIMIIISIFSILSFNDSSISKDTSNINEDINNIEDIPGAYYEDTYELYKVNSDGEYKLSGYSLMDYVSKLYGSNLMSIDEYKATAEEDDPISMIVPKNYFMTEGEFNRNGKIYGYYIKTKKIDEYYESEVFVYLFSSTYEYRYGVPNRIIEDEFSLVPLFEYTYITFNSNNNLPSSMKGYVSKNTDDNNYIIVAKSDNGYNKYVELNKYGISNISYMYNVINKYSYNHFDEEYNPYDDNAYIYESEVSYRVNGFNNKKIESVSNSVYEKVTELQSAKTLRNDLVTLRDSLSDVDEFGNGFKNFFDKDINVSYSIVDSDTKKIEVDKYYNPSKYEQIYKLGSLCKTKITNVKDIFLSTNHLDPALWNSYPNYITFRMYTMMDEYIYQYLSMISFSICEIDSSGYKEVYKNCFHSNYSDDKSPTQKTLFIGDYSGYLFKNSEYKFSVYSVIDNAEYIIKLKNGFIMEGIDSNISCELYKSEDGYNYYNVKVNKKRNDFRIINKSCDDYKFEISTNMKYSIDNDNILSLTLEPNTSQVILLSNMTPQFINLVKDNDIISGKILWHYGSDSSYIDEIDSYCLRCDPDKIYYFVVTNSSNNTEVVNISLKKNEKLKLNEEYIGNHILTVDEEIAVKLTGNNYYIESFDNNLNKPNNYASAGNGIMYAVLDSSHYIVLKEGELVIEMYDTTYNMTICDFNCKGVLTPKLRYIDTIIVYKNSHESLDIEISITSGTSTYFLTDDDIDFHIYEDKTRKLLSTDNHLDLNILNHNAWYIIDLKFMDINCEFDCVYYDLFDESVAASSNLDILVFNDLDNDRVIIKIDTDSYRNTKYELMLTVNNIGKEYVSFSESIIIIDDFSFFGNTHDNNDDWTYYFTYYVTAFKIIPIKYNIKYMDKLSDLFD